MQRHAARIRGYKPVVTVAFHRFFKGVRKKHLHAHSFPYRAPVQQFRNYIQTIFYNAFRKSYVFLKMGQRRRAVLSSGTEQFSGISQRGKYIIQRRGAHSGAGSGRVGTYASYLIGGPRLLIERFTEKIGIVN